jgi:hypothetical protein
MREYRVVKVADINIGTRYLDPEDHDVKTLCDDIHKNGMHDPVLVDDEMNLIDGLRRLQAFGPTDKIDVVVTDDYIDTFEVMKLQVGKPFTRKWTPRRTWDFHVATLPQRKLHHYTRVMDKYGKPKAARSMLDAFGGTKSNSISRDLIGTFAGQPGSWVQAVIYVYSRAYGHIVEPSLELLDLATELVKKMDAGYNVWTARNDYEKARRRNKGRISSEKDQRSTLRRSAASAASLSRVLGDISAINAGITVEEASEYLRAFTQARTDFVAINSLLKERIRKG